MKSYKHFESEFITDYPLEKLAEDIVYDYLFCGTSVKGIEANFFGSEIYRGFLSKTLLNHYGIDTSPESNNRGMYKNESLEEVAKHLLSSGSDSERKVGELLWEKLKRKTQSPRKS